MTFRTGCLSFLALLAVAMSAGPALAGEIVVKVPEPGVLGLVAMGVVGTIMAVRRRK